MEIYLFNRQFFLEDSSLSYFLVTSLVYLCSVYSLFYWRLAHLKTNLCIFYVSIYAR